MVRILGGKSSVWEVVVINFLPECGVLLHFLQQKSLCLHPAGTLALSHLSWDASHEPQASKGVKNARILELENLVLDYY